MYGYCGYWLTEDHVSDVGPGIVVVDKLRQWELVGRPAIGAKSVFKDFEKPLSDYKL